jgi:hypothetical protein
VAETPVVPPPKPPVEAISPLATNHSPLVAPHPAPLAVPAAVALPSSTDHLALLVIAFSLLTIAAVLVIFLIRRSRTPPSLISQSMNRPQ